MSRADDWPSIPYADWKETCAALHLMTQVVGKVRLAQTPWLNHSWHVPLYVTVRGLGTWLIPHPAGAFDIEFDFIVQQVRLRTVEGDERSAPLGPGSIAGFHARLLDALADLGRPVRIHGAPNEVPEATPFVRDVASRPYDGDAVRRFWRALVKTHEVMSAFRTGFLGKSSPVHFFWGSFDLATTRFSGRRAPPHPGGAPNLPDLVAREAYSHEVASVGFWPGGAGSEEAAFYAYAYPEPEGFRTASVRPAQAAYSDALREFVLPYEAVRRADDPEAALMAFLISTYEAAARAGGWDPGLACALGEPGVPRAP